MTTRPVQFTSSSQGELIDLVGDRYRLLADSNMTDGRYMIVEAHVPPGGGPPPHVHSREEEGFYIIQGEMTFYTDEKSIKATAGSFINIPVGLAHWFRNESNRPVKMLILASPGGMENMFRKAGHPAVDATSPISPFGDDEKRLLVLAAAEHGIEIRVPTT